MSQEAILQNAKRASKALRVSSLESRNRTLTELARQLLTEQTQILKANQIDLDALSKDSNAAFRDRLTLTPARVTAMSQSLMQVAALPDPIGEVVEERRLTNGLLTKKIRSPLGVIFMIFESRPNVAIEAFSLALKSGNTIILRGGKESKNTTSFFYGLMREALTKNGLPHDSIIGISDPDRNIVNELLKAKHAIDVVVPRGGDRLIEFVVENSRIPIIKNDRGLCHIYVHEDAKLETAKLIIENAKKQRPGVCNSMETLLVHEKIAKQFLPQIFDQLTRTPHPVTWHGCEKTISILPPHSSLKAADAKNYDTEYLDYELSCKVVSSIDEAIEHIELHGSKHSEAILTETESFARRFQNEVDAAAVYWNASTRFTDGFELGLGGELGISTQKLHVRGPVGLKELTSIRWIMDGNGQIRS